MLPVTRTVLVLLFLCSTGLTQPLPDGFREIPSKDSAELQKLGAQIRLTKTYQADFNQERHLAVFKDILRSTGRIYFQLPDKLRWETREPYVSLLISNGSHVARFLGENGGLKKMQLGMEDMLQQVMGEISGIMRGDFQALFSQYRILLSDSKDHLQLIPRSEDRKKSIASLEFSLEPATGKVTRVVIREPQGDFIEISFFHGIENSPLDESLFSLQSPLPPKKP